MIEVIVKEGIVKSIITKTNIKNHYSIRFSDDTFDEQVEHDESLVSLDKKLVEIIERLHNSDEFRAKWRA